MNSEAHSSSNSSSSSSDASPYYYRRVTAEIDREEEPLQGEREREGAILVHERSEKEDLSAPTTPSSSSTTVLCNDDSRGDADVKGDFFALSLAKMTRDTLLQRAFVGGASGAFAFTEAQPLPLFCREAEKKRIIIAEDHDVKESTDICKKDGVSSTCLSFIARSRPWALEFSATAFGGGTDGVGTSNYRGGARRVNRGSGGEKGGGFNSQLHEQHVIKQQSTLSLLGRDTVSYILTFLDARTIACYSRLHLVGGIVSDIVRLAYHNAAEGCGVLCIGPASEGEVGTHNIGSNDGKRQQSVKQHKQKVLLSRPSQLYELTTSYGELCGRCANTPKLGAATTPLPDLAARGVGTAFAADVSKKKKARRAAKIGSEPIRGRQHMLVFGKYVTRPPVVSVGGVRLIEIRADNEKAREASVSIGTNSSSLLSTGKLETNGFRLLLLHKPRKAPTPASSGGTASRSVHSSRPAGVGSVLAHSRSPLYAAWREGIEGEQGVSTARTSTVDNDGTMTLSSEKEKYREGNGVGTMMTFWSMTEGSGGTPLFRNELPRTQTEEDGQCDKAATGVAFSPPPNSTNTTITSAKLFRDHGAYVTLRDALAQHFLVDVGSERYNRKTRQMMSDRETLKLRNAGEWTPSSSSASSPSSTNYDSNGEGNEGSGEDSCSGIVDGAAGEERPRVRTSRLRRRRSPLRSLVLQAPFWRRLFVEQLARDAAVLREEFMGGRSSFVGTAPIGLEDNCKQRQRHWAERSGVATSEPHAGAFWSRCDLTYRSMNPWNAFDLQNDIKLVAQRGTARHLSTNNYSNHSSSDNNNNSNDDRVAQTSVGMMTMINKGYFAGLDRSSDASARSVGERVPVVGGGWGDSSPLLDDEECRAYLLLFNSSCPIGRRGLLWPPRVSMEPLNAGWSAGTAETITTALRQHERATRQNGVHVRSGKRAEGVDREYTMRCLPPSSPHSSPVLRDQQQQLNENESKGRERSRSSEPNSSSSSSSSTVFIEEMPLLMLKESEERVGAAVAQQLSTSSPLPPHTSTRRSDPPPPSSTAIATSFLFPHVPSFIPFGTSHILSAIPSSLLPIAVSNRTLRTSYMGPYPSTHSAAEPKTIHLHPSHIRVLFESVLCQYALGLRWALTGREAILEPYDEQQLRLLVVGSFASRYPMPAVARLGGPTATQDRRKPRDESEILFYEPPIKYAESTAEIHEKRSFAERQRQGRGRGSGAANTHTANHRHMHTANTYHSDSGPALPQFPPPLPFYPLPPSAVSSRQQAEEEEEEALVDYDDADDDTDEEMAAELVFKTYSPSRLAPAIGHVLFPLWVTERQVKAFRRELLTSRPPKQQTALTVDGSAQPKSVAEAVASRLYSSFCCDSSPQSGRSPSLLSQSPSLPSLPSLSSSSYSLLISPHLSAALLDSYLYNPYNTTVSTQSTKKIRNGGEEGVRDAAPAQGSSELPWSNARRCFHFKPPSSATSAGQGQTRSGGDGGGGVSVSAAAVAARETSLYRRLLLLSRSLEEEEAKKEGSACTTTAYRQSTTYCDADTPTTSQRSAFGRGGDTNVYTAETYQVSYTYPTGTLFPSETSNDNTTTATFSVASSSEHTATPSTNTICTERILPLFPIPVVNLYHYLLRSITLVDVQQQSWSGGIERRMAVFSRVTSPIGPSSVEFRFFMSVLGGGYQRFHTKMVFCGSKFSEGEGKVAGIDKKETKVAANINEQEAFSSGLDGGCRLRSLWENGLSASPESVLFEGGYGRVEVDIRPRARAESYREAAMALKLPPTFPLELLHNVAIVASGACGWLTSESLGLLDSYSGFAWTGAFDEAFAKESAVGADICETYGR